ncbi:DUF2141 domain-containing protein [Novosphingobium sp.]|uniref:DUF2141 domain-containing protein n=1 Tax=Novosphingobium sp. TaxID=1874826 RepID=UPI0025D2D1DB|nr:DUF2141 domain-containing protein [Novosphingobium sp.]
MNPILAATAALAAFVASTACVRAEAAPVAATAPAQAQLTAQLTIAFTGIATPTGAILLSVYDSEATFDGGGKPVRTAMVPATGTSVETALAGLPAGRYAIKAFHDIDGDMKMAVNPFGMPTEPFAFSNDAVGNRGPAKWAAAAFTVTAGANRHSIAIR